MSAVICYIVYFMRLLAHESIFCTYRRGLQRCLSCLWGMRRPGI